MKFFIFLVLVVAFIAAVYAAPKPRLEIWLIDQADTHPDGGGVIYVFHNNSRRGLVQNRKVDLAKAAKAAKVPVGRRPHMSATYPRGIDKPTHILLSNVGSGSLSVLDTKTKKIVGFVDTTGGFNGLGGAANFHFAEAAPSGDFILGVTIGAPGQSGHIHKIASNFRRNRYQLVETLPLGPFASLLGTSLARPQCGGFDQRGLFFVTMASGGVLIFNPGTVTTPVSFIQAFDASLVPGIGCGYVTLDDGRVVSNSGTLTVHGDTDPLDDKVFIWSFNEASGLFENPFVIGLPGTDSHGQTVCTTSAGKQYLWVFMRVTNDVHVIDLTSQQIVRSYNIATGFTSNPAPDIPSATVIDGNLYLAFRGPIPLTGFPTFVDENRTPGLAHLHISSDCLSYTFDESDLYRTDPELTIIPSDPHGSHAFLIK